MTEPDSEPKNDIPKTMWWMMERDTDDLYGRIMAPNKRIQKVRSRFRQSQVDISQFDPETWQVVRSIRCPFNSNL